MKQNVLKLSSFMESGDGWGREQGRLVYPKLLAFIEGRPGVMTFEVSLDDVKHVDISFVSETIVELARRYRGNKGFYLTHIRNQDMEENFDAAAERKEQPITVWYDNKAKFIGKQPSKGAVIALEFALKHPVTRVADFCKKHPDISASNASNKFKQLWQEGFLLRQEQTSETGGVEYVYIKIG